MSQLTVKMVDGREVSGRTVLMDQRGYAKYARNNHELPADQDASTFSLYMAWNFYKRQTGETLSFDDFCEQAEDLEADDMDPTETAT